MVKQVNLLLRQMKKQGSDCTGIISLLKKIFGKHLLKYFISLQTQVIQIYSTFLFVTNFVYVNVYFYVYR